MLPLHSQTSACMLQIVLLALQLRLTPPAARVATASEFLPSLADLMLSCLQATPLLMLSWHPCCVQAVGAGGGDLPPVWRCVPIPRAPVPCPPLCPPCGRHIHGRHHVWQVGTGCIQARADALCTGSSARPCTISMVPACCRVSDLPPATDGKASSGAPGQRPKSDRTRSDPDKWDEEEEW